MRRRAFLLFLILGIILLYFPGAYSAEFIEVYNPAGVRSDGVYVDKLLKRTMVELGKNRPPLAGNFPEGKVEKVLIQADVLTEVNALLYKRGWTDGLPIVPPTPERVKDMLRGPISTWISLWPHWNR